ncbi:hypothetical protein AAC387_Pa12g0600 [Persea americana]
MKSFIWKNIITRFGIPRTLISDNGTQFDSNFFKSFCQEYGIRNVYSTPTTTPRCFTSATPFSLAYGMEAVIPLEIGLPTLRSELCDQGLNDLNVAQELDFAEERREVAAIRLATYQQQLARGYN